MIYNKYNINKKGKEKLKIFKKLLLSIAIVLFALIVVPKVIPSIDSSFYVQAASIKLNKTKLTMNVKEKYTLKVKGTKKKVKWSTSKKSIATVSSKGKVTAKKAGTTTITAKVGGKKYKCKIKVETPKINKTSQTIHINDSYTLKISKTTQKITWSTSNKNVAVVNSKGKVTAKKAGIATITAKVGNSKYYCKVTVKYYGASTYKVGTDIKGGTYCLFNTSKYGAYYEIRKNASSNLDSIIDNNIFNYNSIIEIKNGQYIRLRDCYAVPISEAKINTSGEGYFRVGSDIKAGTYKLGIIGNYGGYYAIYSKAGTSFEYIISNDYWDSGNNYVTVEEGQFLELSNCKIIK